MRSGEQQIVQGLLPIVRIGEHQILCMVHGNKCFTAAQTKSAKIGSLTEPSVFVYVLAGQTRSTDTTISSLTWGRNQLRSTLLAGSVILGITNRGIALGRRGPNKVWRRERIMHSCSRPHKAPQQQEN